MGENSLRPPVPGRTARTARAALLIVFALALTVAGVATAAKQPPHPPGNYAGTSSQNSPVTFKRSRASRSTSVPEPVGMAAQT